jgi:hypothetical protein
MSRLGDRTFDLAILGGGSAAFAAARSVLLQNAESAQSPHEASLPRALIEETEEVGDFGERAEGLPVLG